MTMSRGRWEQNIGNICLYIEFALQYYIEILIREICHINYATDIDLQFEISMIVLHI